MPETEVELYHQRFELLLGKWEQAKRIQPLPLGLRRRYWRFISRLAFEMHQREVRTARLQDVRDVACDAHSPDFHGNAEDLVTDCIHRGILEAEPQGGLSFGHLTYQEFLAARWLEHENPLEFIVEKSASSWWQNTLRFYATSKGDVGSLVAYALQAGAPETGTELLAELVDLAPLTDPGLRSQLGEIPAREGLEEDLDPYEQEWEE